MYDVQESLKAKSNELAEMGKKGTDQQLMLAKQKEITSLLSESMKSQFKPIFVIIPIFLVLYYLALPNLFPSSAMVTFFSMTMNYRSYFILVSFVLGLIFSTGVMIYDSIKRKKLKAATSVAKEPL